MEVRPPRSLAPVSEQPGTGRRRVGERLFGAPAAPSAPRPQRPRTEAPRSLRWAAGVVGLEALGTVAGAAATLWFAATGQVSSTKNAIGIVAVALIGAVLLTVCARGLWRVASWARGPVVAFQLLLALIGYTAAFQYGAPQVGVPVLVLAAVELYLLATPESRLAYYRR
jgi:hypothetical protein